MTILTDEEINVLVREAARGSAINRDGSTSQRIDEVRKVLKNGH